jgi:hypothetical protein
MRAVSEPKPLVECIASRELPLCWIVRAEYSPEATTFVTPPTTQQQVGFVVYPAGGEVRRHEHVPIERRLVGTTEFLLVRSGRCLIDVYDESRALVATRELAAGDLLLLVGGGHGFRMLEPTTLVEVKQGPYTGLAEKRTF